MPKPTKPELAKYKAILVQQLAILRGDVGSMKDEALRASEQDNSVDHLADQGTDNYDQSFMLGLIENEEETIQMIEEAIERIEGRGEIPFGQCFACAEVNEAAANPPPKPKVTKGKVGGKIAKVTKVTKAPAKPEKIAKAKKVEVVKEKEKEVEKLDPWILKDRLAYIPWARYCLRHQEDEERNRETA